MFLLPESYLEVKRIPNTKMKEARGVFARKDIPGGTVIGDYIGMITAEKDEDEEKYGTYYLWYTNKSSIYADPKKPGIHLINHSCMPNVGMIEYKTHMLYFAMRTIFKKEELTVSYDLGYPDEACMPCTHACYCNTPLCTGSMHSTEDDVQEDTTDYSTDEYIQPGHMLPMLTKYPKTIRDHSEENIYGSLKAKPLIVKDKPMLSTKEIRTFIRQTGRRIIFPLSKIEVYGVKNKFLLIKQK